VLLGDTSIRLDPYALLVRYKAKLEKHTHHFLFSEC
jgi:hypothetical protein